MNTLAGSATTKPGLHARLVRTVKSIGCIICCSGRIASNGVVVVGLAERVWYQMAPTEAVS
ncbi:hypothetical protein TSUD_145420 [Trifolium subterraneum]|uniref:Uncharacterized protein n=1 Tax=Trifolium subterraneum TaxID=3900 RepID=A0A2Z6N417_TRISU|nr:hypothetical protein TSUD_145420 [Trifolium subterraneum]